MHNRTNLLFTAGRDTPNHSTGGPLKIIALLVEEFNRSPSRFKIFLNTKEKITSFNGESIQPYDSQQSASSPFNRKLKNSLKRVFGNTAIQLDFYLKNSFYNEQQTKKSWNNWAEKNEPCIIHSHEVLRTRPFLTL